jgi:hypothetical protein
MAVARLESAASRVDAQIEELKSSLQKLDTTPPQDRWTLDSQIDAKVQDLNTLIQKMATDAKGVAGADRDYWDGEVTRYREELSRLNTELRQKRSAAQNQLSDTQRTNVQKGDAVIGNLDEALRIGADTTAAQRQIQETLVEDRAHLENIQGNVEQIHIEADTAKGRLGRMFCRAVVHKILVWIIVAVLGGVFVLSVGLRFGVIDLKKKPTASPSPSAIPPPTPRPQPTPTATPFPPQTTVPSPELGVVTKKGARRFTMG